MSNPLSRLKYRTKRLGEKYAYRLDGDQYGMDVALPDQLEIDESKMSVVIPFADGHRRDGVGDILEIGGIKLERHRKNPIVLFDHGKKVELPIGMACERDDDGKYDLNSYTVKLLPEQKLATLNAFFYQSEGSFPALMGAGSDGASSYDHLRFVEQLFDMIVKGIIRGGSIGYQVIKAQNLAPDYEAGTPQGMHLLSVLMLEGSVVIMPANMDTVRKHFGYDPIRAVLSRGRLCGKPLSPYLVKSLTPYVTPRKAQLGYEKGFRAPPQSDDPTNEDYARIVNDPKTTAGHYAKEEMQNPGRVRQFEEAGWLNPPSSAPAEATPPTTGTTSLKAIRSRYRVKNTPRNRMDRAEQTVGALQEEHGIAEDPRKVPTYLNDKRRRVAVDEYNSAEAEHMGTPPPPPVMGAASLKSVREKYRIKDVNQPRRRGTPKRGRGGAVSPMAPEFHPTVPQPMTKGLKGDIPDELSQDIDRSARAAHADAEAYGAPHHSRYVRNFTSQVMPGLPVDREGPSAGPSGTAPPAKGLKSVRMKYRKKAGGQQGVAIVPGMSETDNIDQAEQAKEGWEGVTDQASSYTDDSKPANRPGNQTAAKAVRMRHAELKTERLHRGADHTKTDVPPARWKPGVGATKSKKDLSGAPTAEEKKPEGVQDHRPNDGWKKDLSSLRKKYRSKAEPPAPFPQDTSGHQDMSGSPVGGLDQYGRRENDIENYERIENSSKPRREAAREDVAAAEKNASSLRKKYRPAKALRRRLKKSSPGASVMMVQEKDLKEAIAAAEKCGLKVKRMGHFDGLEKLKLTGDDEQIDNVAGKFGRPI